MSRNLRTASWKVNLFSSSELLEIQTRWENAAERLTPDIFFASEVSYASKISDIQPKKTNMAEQTSFEEITK